MMTLKKLEPGMILLFDKVMAIVMISDDNTTSLVFIPELLYNLYNTQWLLTLDFEIVD